MTQDLPNTTPDLLQDDHTAQKRISIPPSAAFVPHTIGIVSLGLIGGSFARALSRNPQNTVLGYDINPEVMEVASITSINAELTSNTIADCELIILAGYPEVCISWLKEHHDQISAGTIVIDTAGVKREICEIGFNLAQQHDWHFVGTHPMAGTQYSGFSHASAALFEDAPLVVVPAPNLTGLMRLDVLDRLRELLAPCNFGAMSITTAQEHDKIIAFTSQLAHVVSNAYVKSPTAKIHRGFSAGSYRDLTRVAKLNPQMWCELFFDNADNLEMEIQTLIDNLSAYKDALSHGDKDKLLSLLTEGTTLKEKIDGSN